MWNITITNSIKNGRDAVTAQRRSNPKRVIKSFSVLNHQSLGKSMVDHRCLQAKQALWIETIQRNASSKVIQTRVLAYEEMVQQMNQYEGKNYEYMKQRLKILFDSMQKKGKIGADEKFEDLFGEDGKLIQAKYEEIFGTTASPDFKKKIYNEPADAKSSLNMQEMGDFGVVLNKAESLVDITCEGKDLVERVFGSKAPDAIQNYGKIKDKINKVSSGLIIPTTDRNGDDAEMRVGGYANFRNQSLHLVKNCLNDNIDNQLTVIHECAHLSSSTIIDQGYFGSPGFDSMSEDEKVNNAAHYEVAPGWILGKDRYDSAQPFVPMDKRAVALSKSDQGKRQVCEYLRKTWASALNIEIRLRELYQKPESLNASNCSALDQLSKKIGLVFHLQRDKVKHVSKLDVVMMEDIASKVIDMYSQAQELSLPHKKMFLVSSYKNDFFNLLMNSNVGYAFDKNMLDYIYKFDLGRLF